MHYFITTLVFLTVFSFPHLGWAQLKRTKPSVFAQQNQPQPLTLEQAFPYFVSALSPGKYQVTWNLAPGHYLYRHAFAFTLMQTKQSKNLPIDFNLPDGLKKTDQFFGQIEAYYDKITIDLSLNNVPGPEASIIIHYQGCADWGFCYPPQRVPFQLLP